MSCRHDVHWPNRIGSLGLNSVRCLSEPRLWLDLGAYFKRTQSIVYLWHFASSHLCACRIGYSLRTTIKMLKTVFFLRAHSQYLHTVVEYRYFTDVRERLKFISTNFFKPSTSSNRFTPSAMIRTRRSFFDRPECLFRSQFDLLFRDIFAHYGRH